MFDLGAEKMTEWLRTLAALLEDPAVTSCFSGQSLAILDKDTHKKIQINTFFLKREKYENLFEKFSYLL